MNSDIFYNERLIYVIIKVALLVAITLFWLAVTSAPVV